MASPVDLGVSSLGALFGGSGMTEAARTAKENQSLEKFQDLLERTTHTNKVSIPVQLASAQTPIDKTSKLYEQALELESFFVKIMLSSMRNTITKSGLNDESHAQKIYEDMMYDEFSSMLTKNAGFGLADQMYSQLVSLEA